MTLFIYLTHLLDRPDYNRTNLSPNFHRQQNQSSDPDSFIDPNDDDIIDFLLSQEAELGLTGMYPSIEELLINKNEITGILPRIAKLFNFIATYLEVYTNFKDPLSSQASLQNLIPFIRLLINASAISKSTQLSFFCMKPPAKLRMRISFSFFQDLLYFASTTLNDAPALQAALIQFLEFILTPSDVFSISITNPYQVVFGHFLQNIYDKPEKDLLKFLSQVFYMLPSSLIGQYYDELLLPVLELLEVGLQNSKSSKSNKQLGNGENAYEFDEMNFMKAFEAEENLSNDEIFTQAAKVLFLSQTNPNIKSLLAAEEVYRRLYALLRASQDVTGEGKKIKVSTKCSLMLIQCVASLLERVDEAKKKQLTDEMYADLLLSLEQTKSKFLGNVILPLLSAPALSVVPVCINLDKDPDELLTSIKSSSIAGVDLAQGSATEQNNSQALPSQLLTPSEKKSLLGNIQKLSLSSEKEKFSIESFQWKQELNVDFNNPYGGNPNNIKYSLPAANGSLFIFHCLLGQEIAKIGMYCNTKMYQNNIPDGYSSSSGGIRAVQDPSNFLFYYSDSTRLHFLTSEADKKIEPLPQKVQKNAPLVNQKAPPSNMNEFSYEDDEEMYGGDQNYNEEDDDDADWEDEYGGQPSYGLYLPGAAAVNNLLTSKIPCIEYINNRIALFHQGKPLLEYFPSNPDGSKVSLKFNNVKSVEEKAGKALSSIPPDSGSICFIQGVEIWTIWKDEAAVPIIDGGQDLTSAEMTDAVKRSFDEVFKVIRSEKPVYLIPREMALGEYLDILCKEKLYSLGGVELRCNISRDITLKMKMKEVESLFNGSEHPQIIDLFVGGRKLVQHLQGGNMLSSQEMYAKIIEKEGQETLLKSMISKDRTKALLTKVMANQAKGAGSQCKLFNELMAETQVFSTITTFEHRIVGDEEFAKKVLGMLGRSSNPNIVLKMNQRVYSTLEVVLNGDDKAFLLEMDITKFLCVLLKKIKALDKAAVSEGLGSLKGEIEVSKVRKQSQTKVDFNKKINWFGLKNMFASAPEENKVNDPEQGEDAKGKETVDDVISQLQFSVVMSLLSLMENELPNEVYDICFEVVRKEKIMTSLIRLLSLPTAMEIKEKNDAHEILQKELFSSYI